jgi:hypothetical protein
MSKKSKETKFVFQNFLCLHFDRIQMKQFHIIYKIKKCFKISTTSDQVIGTYISDRREYDSKLKIPIKHPKKQM